MVSHGIMIIYPLGFTGIFGNLENFFFFLFLNDLELVLFFFFSFYLFVHTGSIVSFINLTSHGVTQNYRRNKVNLMSEESVQYQIRVNESTC